MLTIVFYMILIQLIIVILIDCSDLPITIKKTISFLLTKGKIKSANFQFHLADCSFCIQWWANFVYLLYIGKFIIPYIALALFLSFMTPITKDLLFLIKNIIINIIFKINNLVE